MNTTKCPRFIGKTIQFDPTEYSTDAAEGIRMAREDRADWAAYYTKCGMTCKNTQVKGILVLEVTQ